MVAVAASNHMEDSSKKPTRSFSIWSSMQTISGLLSGHLRSKRLPQPSNSTNIAKTTHIIDRQPQSNDDRPFNQRFSIITSSDSGFDSLPCYYADHSSTLSNRFFTYSSRDVKEAESFNQTTQNVQQRFLTPANPHPRNPPPSMLVNGSVGSIDSGCASGEPIHVNRPITIASSSTSSMANFATSSASFSTSESITCSMDSMQQQDVTLEDWLCKLRLPQYINLFTDNGIDMNIVHRLTPQDMIAIGIANPIHRRLLRAAILKLNKFKPPVPTQTTCMKQWLENLGISQYYDSLVAQGYHSVSDLLAISDEDLDDIGITRLGHQLIFKWALKSSTTTAAAINSKPQPSPSFNVPNEPIPNNNDNYDRHHQHQLIKPPPPQSPSSCYGIEKHSLNDIDLIIDNIKRDLDAMVAYRSVSNV